MARPRFNRRQADFYNDNSWKVYKNDAFVQGGLTRDEAGKICRQGNTGDGHLLRPARPTTMVPWSSN